MTTLATTQDSIGRTLLIAVALALVCSAMVSGTVYWLRPIKAANEQVERNRAITEVAGLAAPGDSSAAVTDAFFDLNARVWDRQAGEFNNLMDGRTFDHWAQSEGGAKDADRWPRYVPVYVVKGGPTRIVLPVHGQGMWSTLYGYVGLAPDFNTITGAQFHQHGETPGVGDRIQDPAWLRTWRGKRVYDASGRVRFDVSNDAALAAAHRVDLIAGASVTAEKVGALVHDWMGPEGYQPMLDQLKTSED